MQLLGLGKIAVATAGTPVAVSATKLMVHSFTITYDPADSSKIYYLKDVNNNVIASIDAQDPFQMGADANSNAIDLSLMKIDVKTNGEGPFVGYSLL